MNPNKKSAIDNFIKDLDFIAELEPTTLAEGKELGAIHFRAGLPLFEQTIQLANEFRSLPLDLLPLTTLQQLHSPIRQWAESLRAILSFTLVGRSNPESERNTLLSNAQTYHDQAFTQITPHLAYLSLKSAQVQETMRRSAELLKETKEKVDNDLKEVKGKKEELDSIVQAARDAASKIGVARFATKFEDISKDHDQLSEKWLKATIGLTIGTVIAAVALLLFLPPLADMSDPATIQRIITKVVIISILYYSAIWSSRNYRSHRHLSVVNKHRQSALSTFETFVNATDDKQIKNAVLLEATHCIFSPAVSGYLGADEENPSNRVIEILKTVSEGTVSK